MYKEVLIGNTEGNILSLMYPIITQGKVYSPLFKEEFDHCGYEEHYLVIDDSGRRNQIHKSWFTPAKLYDEDEEELHFNGVEFEEGDYLDLSKHTPEQIAHIYKFYPCFRGELLSVEEGNPALVWEVESGLIGASLEVSCLGRELHFNNLFSTKDYVRYSNLMEAFEEAKDIDDFGRNIFNLSGGGIYCVTRKAEESYTDMDRRIQEIRRTWSLL